MSCAPANGFVLFRTPMAAGAKAAKATTTMLRRSQSTPSQTAWAVLGLLAGGDQTSSSLQKGVEWLIEHQTADGTWSETLSTGTGFPKVFFLSYHLYRNSFPAACIIRISESKRLPGSTAVGAAS